MNVLIAFNFLSGVTVLAIWLVAKGLGVLWGLFSGGAAPIDQCFAFG